MTARLTLNSPLLLGFDHLERTLDRLAKSSGDGYPPYNVEQMADGGLRITLAVAGFGPADLAVQVEGNQLIVRGRQSEDGQDRLYLHRGIAARQFQKAFLLADGIEVNGASLDNGLLHIRLARPVLQERVRHIDIVRAHGTDHATTLNVEKEKALAEEIWEERK